MSSCLHYSLKTVDVLNLFFRGNFLSQSQVFFLLKHSRVFIFLLRYPFFLSIFNTIAHHNTHPSVIHKCELSA